MLAGESPFNTSGNNTCPEASGTLVQCPVGTRLLWLAQAKCSETTSLLELLCLGSWGSVRLCSGLRAGPQESLGKEGLFGMALFLHSVHVFMRANYVLRMSIGASVAALCSREQATDSSHRATAQVTGKMNRV